MATIILDGSTLSVDQLFQIAHEKVKVKVKKSCWDKVKFTENYTQQKIREDKTIYGFNTGFGALAQVRIKPDLLRKLQDNILLSHNAGVGNAFPEPAVRAAIALRINTLIKGYSGVSTRLIRTLIALLNKNIIPVVPQKGSVGASGDLAPMAAIGLCLIGKGKVYYKEKKMSARIALKRAGIKKIQLKVKEGLSLINGTQFSTGIAALVCREGLHLADLADISGAMSLDALRGTDMAFHHAVTDLRPHPGARISAKNIRHLIRGSKILHSHRNCPKVQEPYSLRCMAQVHGAVRDIFTNVGKCIQIEMNSVTDNPLIIPQKDLIISNGNFHGEPIAFSLDMMTMGLTELSSISERWTFRMLDSKLSGINPFLTKKPGLNSGFMMAQVTAAALVSQNKALSYPASVDSIPTSANQEDHVSMSMNAGLKAIEVLDNAKYVYAIELLCNCQALDLLKPLNSSAKIMRIQKKIRKVVPFIKRDQPLTQAIEKIKKLIDAQNLFF